MSYDLFVSYCHEDLVWAEKLERALTSLGLSGFRDTTTIRAGQGRTRLAVGYPHSAR